MSFHATALGGTELVIPNGIASNPKEIIKELRGRPNLKSLKLSHNALYGEGSKVLFQWLAYGDNDGNDGQNSLSLPLPQLTSIDLSSVQMGNMGLSALVVWLERLQKKQLINMNISPSKIPDGMHSLLLQNNCIEGTSELALVFISALTFRKMEPPYVSSSLYCLNLSSNPLSSGFKQALFASLASLPSLHILALSMTGLNQADTGALAAYIGQCRLTDFNASANNMGYSGLKRILKAMKRCWTLERVDLYANDIENKGDDEYESSEGERPQNIGLAFMDNTGTRWRILECQLQRILSRNLYLKRTVRDQAFELLRYSRLLLLNRLPDHGRLNSEPDLLEELVGQEASHHSRCCHNCECLPTFHNSQFRTPSPVLIDPPRASTSHFPFTHLPIEIQLTILSHLAPLLSSSQHVRIFEHAVDKTTLPDLSLRLPPSSGGGGILRVTSSSISTYASGGLGGGFAGPGNSARYSAQGGGSFATEKQKWLELVGCDAYDPNQ